MRLSVEQVIVMLHSELATAVSSVKNYGAVDGFFLESIRVRMGEGSNQNALLDNQLFPYADQGWLIDVNYNYTESFSLTNTGDDYLSFNAISFFEKKDVSVISGIGYEWSKQLALIDINTIKELYDFDLFKDVIDESVISLPRLRGFQSLARLVLSIPVTDIPKECLDLSFEQFLNDYKVFFSKEPYSQLSREKLEQLYGWVQQLELCLDNNYLYSLHFSDLLLE